MAKTVLIADDDPTQRRLLQAAVERQGFLTRLAEDGPRAIAMATAADVVLLDLVMPGVNGMEAVQAIRGFRPDLPIIVLTGHGGVDTAVNAMQAGANDFLVKPASPERVVVSIRNVLKLSELTGEVKRLSRKAADQLTFDDLIAAAPAMRHVVRLARRAAASGIPVLVLGESGVGKELLARATHGESERAGKPFVAVNCGAIPENLVESILFGHEKGAFTGAHDRHLGKFVEADGGTLFLDEVGELPLDIQVKLLRALQESEVDPVGAKRPVKVDVRIVAATNRDLGKLVEEGRFREDLFYRLNVFPIEAPPLRERRDDIPALVRHFVSRFNAEEGKQIIDAAPQTHEMLAAYDWPGNVRQLENAVFRAVVLADGQYLTPEDFPQISGLKPQLRDVEGPVRLQPAPVSAPQSGEAQGVQAPQPGQPGVEILDAAGHLRSLEAIEKDLISFALTLYDGHMSQVARRLGIGRSTLYRKLKEYGLDPGACALEG